MIKGEIVCRTRRQEEMVLGILATGYVPKKCVKGGIRLEDGRIVRRVDWSQHPSTFKMLYTLRFK